MNEMTLHIEKSISYLASKEALQNIELDPYWSKWDSPWWHMLLLYEMNLTKKIPKVAILKMIEILKSHYLPVFPIKEEEVPRGTDPYRGIACLCAVGSIYQVLFDYGIEVDRELPWMRSWFLRYQLPDGGLNCDEEVYTKPVPKSSVVSTLPCLEAVLFCSQQELTAEELKFIDKGASYLLKQKLFRRVSTGEVIDKDWMEIRFPRFYEYDFLRGFYFLAKWRKLSGFMIPDELVDEVEELVSQQWTEEGIHLKRYNLFDNRSYNLNPGGTWEWGEASEFDLMKAVSFGGSLCRSLSEKWNEVKPKKVTATEDYEIAYKNPIKLKVGDLIKIEKREINPDWIGWIYCVDNNGTAGWVSERYLKESNGATVAVKDYDATELAVSEGEHLKVYFEEFGWCWCRNSTDNKGWVPSKILKEI